MLVGTAKRFNEECTRLVAAKDMAALQKYLTESTRADGTNQFMFDALMAVGSIRGSNIISKDSPLSKAIDGDDDKVLALLIHHLIINHGLKIEWGNSSKGHYLNLDTNEETIYYKLPEIGKTLVQKVANNLEFFAPIDKAFEQDREDCLLGRNLPKINFAKFDLDFFEKVYLKDIKGDHDKRLIAYRILNACAKSPDSPKENKERAQQLMKNLRAEHSLHRSKVNNMHDGKYLNENSALGKFVLKGDKKKIAQLMVKAQESHSKIETKDIASVLRSNASLDIQMALFDIAAEHNNRVTAPKNKSRFNQAMESIANFFNNITIFNKILGNDAKAVGNELKDVLGMQIAHGTGAKAVLGALNYKRNPFAEEVDKAAASKVEANAKFNPSAEDFGREDTAPPVKNVDKPQTAKAATNKERAIKELKDLCEVFNIEFPERTNVDSPKIRAEYQKAIDKLRFKVLEEDLHKLDRFEIALCPKEPGVNR